MKLRDKITYCICLCISWLPFSGVRIFLYRLYGYDISGSFIGWRTLIHVSKFELNNSRIESGNRFFGPMSVYISSRTHIDKQNIFTCGYWTLKREFAQATYPKQLHIGQDVLITNHHYFDVVGTIKIGDKCVIGGRGSEFWTHGAKSSRRTVDIGEQSYIGSGCKFGPGSAVERGSTVSLGSVLNKIYAQPYVVLSGNPAKVVRRGFKWWKR